MLEIVRMISYLYNIIESDIPKLDYSWKMERGLNVIRMCFNNKGALHGTVNTYPFQISTRSCFTL